MLKDMVELIEAPTVDQVWEKFLAHMGEFGFPKAIYAFSHFRQQATYDDIEDVLFLSNHDKAYLDVFIGEGLYRNAPMVTWAANNVGTASWRLVAERFKRGELSEAEQRVLAFNRKMGVKVGYTISFKGVSARTKGALGLVGAAGMSQDDVDAIWARDGRYLTAASILMHLKISNLPRSAPTNLTQRQREALEWVADGKTTQDIAILMGISTAMVEKHLRLARNALDVETTAHAVAKAARLNQIFVVSQ